MSLTLPATTRYVVNIPARMLGFMRDLPRDIDRQLFMHVTVSAWLKTYSYIHQDDALGNFLDRKEFKVMFTDHYEDAVEDYVIGPVFDDTPELTESLSDSYEEWLDIVYEKEELIDIIMTSLFRSLGVISELADVTNFYVSKVDLRRRYFVLGVEFSDGLLH